MHNKNIFSIIHVRLKYPTRDFFSSNPPSYNASFSSTTRLFFWILRNLWVTATTYIKNEIVKKCFTNNNLKYFHSILISAILLTLFSITKLGGCFSILKNGASINFTIAMLYNNIPKWICSIRIPQIIGPIINLQKFSIFWSEHKFISVSC